ncbi:hypothetical protein TNCV_378091 [Trichonephila clavipes]|nr:hypothetical protein TNCV_378091 [Trichonephila clavipes]
MSRSGGQSEARPPVLKSPSKLRTHLSISPLQLGWKVESTLPGPGIERGPYDITRYITSTIYDISIYSGSAI